MGILVEGLCQVLALGWMVLAGYGAGTWASRRFPFGNRLEALVFRVTLGWGLWGTFLFGLAVVGILYREVVWLGTAALGIVGAWSLRKTGGAGEGEASEVDRPMRGRWIHWVGWGCFFGIAGLLYVRTLYPPGVVLSDATVYHLVAARESLVHHRLPLLVDTAMPVSPALYHMLLAWALALRGDVLAQGVSWVFWGLVAGGLGTLGLRVGRPGLGLVAALGWAATPMAQWIGTAAQADVGVTAFGFLGLAALYRWGRGESPAWAGLGLALLAMGAGTKMTGLVWWAAGALWVLVRYLGRKLESGWVWRGLLVSGLLVVPWYAWIAYHTGSPLWPAMPVGSRGIWRAAALEWHYWYGLSFAGMKGTARDFITLLRLPWSLTVGDDTGFAIPWAIGLWGLTLLGLIYRPVRWWTAWTWLLVGVWWGGVGGTTVRWLAPIIPTLVWATVESILWVEAQWSGIGVIRRWLGPVSLVGLTVWGSWSLVLQFRAWGSPPGTPAEREALLRRVLLGYRAVEWINRQARPGDRVCSAYGSHLTYFWRPPVAFVYATINVYLLRKSTGTVSPAFPTVFDRLFYIDTRSDGWVRWALDQGCRYFFILPQWLFDVPFPHMFWQVYRLVYIAPDAWVFKRSETPLRVVSSPLEGNPGGCHRVVPGHPLVLERRVIPGRLLVRFWARSDRPGRFHWRPESSMGTWSRWVGPEGQAYSLLIEGPPVPGRERFFWSIGYGHSKIQELEVCDVQVWTFEQWEGRGPE